MNHICQNCGYESPIEARFCRQCGKQMFVETELSGASTRNYGRQEPAPYVATVGSGQLPPSVSDVIGGETERYYQAPYVPRPVITPTAPIKSGNRPWRYVLMFFILLLGIALGAMVAGSRNRPRRDPISAEENARRQAEREARRQQDQLRRETNDRLREAKDRVREAQDRVREAMDRMREASEQASVAGATLSMTSEKLIDFTQYEYPNATATNEIRIPGREMLTMRTADNFEIVSQYYQKKIGKPIIRINESWENKIVFQSTTNPAVAIAIETVPGDRAPELKITVLRSPFRTLKPLETEAEP